MLPPEQERSEGGRRGAGDFAQELLEPGASFAAGAKRVGDAGMAESQREPECAEQRERGDAQEDNGPLGEGNRREG